MSDKEAFDKWLSPFIALDIDGRVSWSSELAWKAWKAAVKAEREECAKLCENVDFDNCWTGDSEYDSGMLQGARVCIDAIRNRSN